MHVQSNYGKESILETQNNHPNSVIVSEYYKHNIFVQSISPQFDHNSNNSFPSKTKLRFQLKQLKTENSNFHYFPFKLQIKLIKNRRENLVEDGEIGSGYVPERNGPESRVAFSDCRRRYGKGRGRPAELDPERRGAPRGGASGV